MKQFSRSQLRTVFQAWKNQSEFHEAVEAGVNDFLLFLDTYEFKEKRMPMGRATGIVKWFNTQKGFGFIVPDEGGEDVFVHFTSLNGLKLLHEGDRVEFDVESGSRGVKAVDVVMR